MARRKPATIDLDESEYQAKPARKPRQSTAVAAPVSAEQEEMQLAERMKGVVGRLMSEVQSRIVKRQPIEDRWIEELEQYHGKYDSKTERELNKGKKSKIFINLTQPKTDACSAKLADLLFPTDDRNWGIQPTPVPLLNDDAAKAVKALRAIEEKIKAKEEEAEAAAAAQEGGAPPEVDPELKKLEEEADVARRLSEALQQIIDEAKHRAEAMQLEIDDQLKESHYHAVMRDVIEDACKFGTGVCKGPVTGDKLRKGWKKQKLKDKLGNEVYGDFTLDVGQAGDSPAMRYVDLWNYFPDMDVNNVQKGEGDYERHLLNKKGMRALAKLPGFDKAAIRRLLSAEPMTPAPQYLANLRDITGSTTTSDKSTYHVFEYTGPLSAEDLRDIAAWQGDEDTLAELEEIDPLDEVNAIIWFCDGEVLKIAPYPFDSGETIYSVFNLIKDESSPFGYGIPHIIRDPQRGVNSGYRAMMDNAGLASGPQFIISRQHIEPADGNWTIEPRKVWIAKEGLPENRRAFQVEKVDMVQAELANIIAISKQFIDDMTGMPSLAQGEDGAGPVRTAQGTALLMNSANVIMRRIVKSFDDDVTTPNIRRLYDWNMQFSKKAEIKGDYNIDARGSSVLLVREMQAQNLMVIALHLGAHPVYGPMLKSKGVLRKLFQAHMIPADEVLLTDDEIDAILAKAAMPQEDPALAAMAEAKKQELELRREEMENKVEIANMEADTRRFVAQRAHETAMMSIAEKMNMQMDQLRAMLEKSRMQIESDERQFAAEAAVTERIGGSGGGHF